jgi:hypothetical protein
MIGDVRRDRGLYPMLEIKPTSQLFAAAPYSPLNGKSGGKSPAPRLKAQERGYIKEVVHDL